jgi:hypothetical protein
MGQSAFFSSGLCRESLHFALIWIVIAMILAAATSLQPTFRPLYEANAIYLVSPHLVSPVMFTLLKSVTSPEVSQDYHDIPYLTSSSHRTGRSSTWRFLPIIAPA